MLFSVIVPCYNSYKYMNRCFEYFENQSFKDFEVVIIDDCSTDDSFAKLKDYAKESELNIKLLHNEKNIGPGASRNRAIAACDGEWLTFCDSDDWFNADFFGSLKQEVSGENPPDLLLYDYTKVFDSGLTHNVKSLEVLNGNFTKENLLANFVFSFSLCCVKKEIAVKYPIADLYNGEDFATVPIWIKNSERIAVIEKSFYNYYMRNGSASRAVSKNAMNNLNNSFKYVESLKDCYYPEVEYIGIKNCLYGATLSGFKAKNKKSEICCVIKDFKKSYPEWYKNKYLSSYSLSKKIYLMCIKYEMYYAVRLLAYIHYLIHKI